MLGLKDQSNRRIVRNYVQMAEKPLFSAKEVIIETGVSDQTVRNVLRLLELDGIVSRLSKRIHGRVYYRLVDAAERCENMIREELKSKSISQMAREKGVSKQYLCKKLSKAGVKSSVVNTSKYQMKVLAALSDGKWHLSSEINNPDTLRALERKEWVMRVKEGRFNSYAITVIGLEVLEGKVIGDRFQVTADRRSADLSCEDAGTPQAGIPEEAGCAKS